MGPILTYVPILLGSVLVIGCWTKFELQSLLSSQFFMLTFLPQSHPQSYLPMLFRLWESINSYMYDERMLQFLAQLAEMHVEPAISDPKKIDEIPDDARSENESRPNWSKNDLSSTGIWTGIYKDVGIFSDYDWHFIMCKCLASMGWCLFKSHSIYISLNVITTRNSTCGLGISYHGPVCR
jgi:proteasome activator subunit 4